MSIQQLSPGDKLSLKGKLFELQKKLTIIDMENKQQPEYSFQPEIKSYDLPSRHEDFGENVRRAEDARQEKLNSLKSTLEREQEGECTFSPQVIARRPARRVPGKGQSQGGPKAGPKPKQSADSRPAYERLYDQGAEYRKAQEARKQRALQFDEDGRKLFAPTLPAGSKRINRQHTSTVGVDDFLYRAALERNERLDSLRHTEEEVLREQANASKVNKRSENLLRKKYEREVREACEVLQLLEGSAAQDAPPPASTDATLSEDDESYDGEVSLSSDGLNSEGDDDVVTNRTEEAVEAADADATGTKGPLKGPLITLRQIQEALCLLCEEPDGGGCPPIWQHEDGRHSVAGGSMDPYHIATLVWRQLLGKQQAETSALIDQRRFVTVCVHAMLKRRKGQVDLLSHFVSRVNMIEVAPPSPPVQDRFSKDGYCRLSAGGSTFYDTVNFETSTSRSGHTRRAAGFVSKRPPGVGLAEVTKLDALEHDRRVEQLRREQEAREMEECTFAPRLYTKYPRNGDAGFDDSSSVMTRSDQADDGTENTSIFSTQSVCSGSLAGRSMSSRVAVHERLYALKNKVPTSIAKEKHRRKEDIELDECTFTPNVQTRVPPLPEPVFKDGVEKEIPQLAESAGVRILGDGDIVFGNTIPATVQSVSGITLTEADTHKSKSVRTRLTSIDQGRSPQRTEKTVRAQPPVDDDDAMYLVELEGPRQPQRNSSYVSVINEFKQTDAYASPAKRRSVEDMFSPADDDISDSGNFVGYSYRDMETVVSKFENSLNPLDPDQEDAKVKNARSCTPNSESTNRKKPSIAANNIPHGFAESIVRARLSREQRVRQQNAKEQLGKFSEEKYQKSRLEAAKGSKPSKLHSQHTKASAAKLQQENTEADEIQRDSASPVKSAPRLYIDVKLGSLTKVPKIAVNDGDNPAQLARDFCRIYALRGDTEKILTEVIVNSMRQNNIPLGGEVVRNAEDSGNDRTSATVNNREVAPFRPPAPPPPPNRPRVQQDPALGPRPPEPPPRSHHIAPAISNEVRSGRLPVGELHSALNAIFLGDGTDSGSEV